MNVRKRTSWSVQLERSYLSICYRFCSRPRFGIKHLIVSFASIDRHVHNFSCIRKVFSNLDLKGGHLQ